MKRDDDSDIREVMQMLRDGKLSRMPALDTPAAILLGIYCFLCLAYLPVCRSEALSGVILLITAVIGAMTLRSAWVIGMLAVPTCLLVMATGSLAVAAVPLSLLCGTAYGAFLLLNLRKKQLLAIPPAAFAVGLLATGELGAASLALLGLPAMLTMARCLRTGLPRVRAICRVAVALVAPMLALALITVAVRQGLGAFADVPSAITAARHALADLLAAWTTGAGESTSRVVREGMELAMANALFNILPGLLLALIAVFAYFVNLVCLSLFRAYEFSKYLSARVFILGISLPAATLFLVGYLLLLILGDGGSLREQFAAVVAENVYFALLPAMVLVGFLTCVQIFLGSSHRLLMVVGAIILIAMFPAAVLTALSLLGACSVVWETLRRLILRSRSPD